MRIFKSSKVNLKKLIFLFVISFLLNACNKCKPPQENAIDKLVLTLKSQNPNCTCEPFINQYNWRNQLVYVLAYKGSACDWKPIYYDSKVNQFEMTSDYKLDNFLQESQLLKNVWICN